MDMFSTIKIGHLYNAKATKLVNLYPDPNYEKTLDYMDLALDFSLDIFHPLTNKFDSFGKPSLQVVPIYVSNHKVTCYVLGRGKETYSFFEVMLWDQLFIEETNGQ